MRRWAICFYWLAVGVAMGHMFLLVGCGRGARPYGSIMYRWAICLYWLAVGHMFLLCVCMCICVCVCVYVCVCMCICVCVYVFTVKELVGAIEVVQTSECSNKLY